MMTHRIKCQPLCFRFPGVGSSHVWSRAHKNENAYSKTLATKKKKCSRWGGGERLY